MDDGDAVPEADIPHDQIGVAHRHVNLELVASAAEGRIDEAARVGGLRVGNEGIPGDILQRDAAPRRQRVVAGSDENHLVGAHGPRGDAGPLGVHQDYPDIDGAVGDRRDDLARAQVLDGDLDGRKAMREEIQLLRQNVHGGGLVGGDVQDGRRRLLQALEDRVNAVHVGEDALGVFQEQFTLARQRHRPRPPEKLDAEFGLQVLDLLADRGLGQVQQARGLGEPAALGDRVESVQAIQIHRRLLL